MDLKEELISDTIDDVMGDDDEEEERYVFTSSPFHNIHYVCMYILLIFLFLSSEGIVQQVFDELGLQWDDEVCLSLSLSTVYILFSFH